MSDKLQCQGNPLQLDPSQGSLIFQVSLLVFSAILFHNILNRLHFSKIYYELRYRTLRSWFNMTLELHVEYDPAMIGFHLKEASQKDSGHAENSKAAEFANLSPEQIVDVCDQNPVLPYKVFYSNARWDDAKYYYLGKLAPLFKGNVAMFSKKGGVQLSARLHGGSIKELNYLDNILSCPFLHSIQHVIVSSKHVKSRIK